MYLIRKEGNISIVKNAPIVTKKKNKTLFPSIDPFLTNQKAGVELKKDKIVKRGKYIKGFLKVFFILY